MTVVERKRFNPPTSEDLMRGPVPEKRIGSWEVDSFTVSEQDAKFGRLRAMIKDGRWVPEGTYRRLSRIHSRMRRGVLVESRSIVMSDTPNELQDHHEPWMRAKGLCLVNGLGLGCLARGMLRKREILREEGGWISTGLGDLLVEKVTVIELEQDVIDLVGPSLVEEFGDRIEIIHADAMTWKAPRGSRWEVVWHDIWENICEDNLEEMKTLHRRYGRRSNWQGSWSRNYFR